MAMKDFLNNNYKKFEEFKVRDSEASVWMLMNEPLEKDEKVRVVLEALINLGDTRSLRGLRIIGDTKMKYAHYIIR
jgi:hypothetical protein